MLRRSLPFACCFACFLLAALASPAAAEDAAGNPLAAAEVVATTAAQPGCDLSGFDLELLAPTPLAATSASVEISLPELLTDTAAKLGYCRCGCGARCRTSADCGGAACVAAISCC